MSLMPSLPLSLKDVVHDLDLLVRSHHALIFLDADDPDRVSGVIRYLAFQLGMPLYSWAPSTGLKHEGTGNTFYGTTAPNTAFSHIESAGQPAVCHFQGLESQLGDPVVCDRLRTLTNFFQKNGGVMIVSGHGISTPDSLRVYGTFLRLPEPSFGDYGDLLDGLVAELSNKKSLRVDLAPSDREKILRNLKGFTLLEAKKILTKALIEDLCLDSKDLEHVISAKKALVEREGLLEYYPVSENMEDIAGLEGLKDWLGKRQEFMMDHAAAQKFGLSFPRGILLLGVQGCGKSLCAKAVAKEWGLPLLKLDPSRIYDKYIGETEKKFTRAIETAERVAPVVLWIDEIEKAFSQSAGDADGGVNQRVFGTFLSWLQERKGDVFVVATANDIDRLPPEFVRKGRFDEIFFVDLPTAGAREKILAIHLRRRGQEPREFDLPEIVSMTDGFSGAEIEQCVISALYSAFAVKRKLDSAILVAEIKATRPLSVTMAEKIDRLRAWAADRTASAEAVLR